ncbi:MAG: stage II sporulation protein M [Armatimonadota bacterium]|nr:stage II sporulation protein M [Armatimonadota bacterium]
MNSKESGNLKPEWRELSGILEKARASGVQSLSAHDLARLGPLYRLAVADLALARSHDAGSGLVSFLNDLVARGYGLIYTSPPSRIRQALRFVVSGFPALARRERRAIGLATAVFLAGAVFAFITVSRDPSTQSAFVPPMFARESRESRESRKSPGPGIPDALKPVLSSAIMSNNIQVSITAFASGITFGILTIYILLQNGMMLGGLAASFGRGDSLVFWSLILPHGIIELAAICISGGAGLIIAGALIRPGNRSRWDSVKLAARRAIPLMGGVALMLVAAGAIEGFLTPSKLSPGVKLAFAGLTAALLALYFASPWRGGVGSGKNANERR